MMQSYGQYPHMQEQINITRDRHAPCTGKSAVVHTGKRGMHGNTKATQQIRTNSNLEHKEAMKEGTMQRGRKQRHICDDAGACKQRCRDTQLKQAKLELSQQQEYFTRQKAE